MKKIRIGNDIVIKWRVTINGEEVNLEGLDLSLYISTTYQPRKQIAFTVAGNEITATFKGVEQKVTGVYRLTLYRNEGENAQSILDACDAFELVSCSCLTVDAAFGGAEVELPVADLGVGIPGLSAYEIACIEGFKGTQAEWIASLSAASEAAAAECREVIAEFSQAEDSRVTAEAQRVANENNRIAGEGSRVEAENDRAAAEQLRATAESKRDTAELARIANENNRADAEDARSSAEGIRVSNENTRLADEETRVQSEAARVTAESKRANAEAARVEAETARVEEFAGFSTAIAAKEDVANKVTSINADADDVHYPSAKAVWSATDAIISDMNASVLIAGSIPNFNTTTKTFDFGNDTFIISNSRYYEIKSLVANGSYRNINYCAAGETSSLQKFVYNTISKTLRFENAIRPAVAGDIALGCIKRVLSSGVIGYVGFTFKYAINGINIVDNLVEDVNEIKPKIETLDSFDGRITSLEESVNYTKIENFYKDAWVRYSDGLVQNSAGGAKLYIIKKEDLNNATKIRAFVTTESTTFAAIAFFNGEPSSSTYIQSASIQGKNDRLGAWYEAALPTEDWYCALILDMSQYGNRKSIIIDEPSVDIALNKIQNIESNTKSNANNFYGAIFNVVAYSPYYHHLNQEQSKSVIPAQSLFDIHYAKSLGFKMIEVNVHKCSDGVFVCKHGVSGTLGRGLKSKDGQDYSNTAFADVSSEWLRENISYDVYLEKYNGFIPTLDEFCRECKKLSILLKISTSDRGVLNIARKYLTDDMLWTLFRERDDFRGTIEYVYDKSKKTVDTAITECKTIGAPLNIVIAAGTFANYTDGELTELVEKAHINGFTVSMVYPTTNDVIRALSFGVDAICSTNTNANLMSIGNAKNISSLDDSDLIISNGSQYDSGNDIIRLVDAGTIKVNADKVLTYKQYGMCTVRVRYKGVLTIVIGENSNTTNLKEYENDGNKEISFCNVLQPSTDVENFSEWITIISQGSTEIYSLDIKCSYV